MSRLATLVVCAATLSSSIVSPVLAAEAAQPDTMLVVTEKSLHFPGPLINAPHI